MPDPLADARLLLDFCRVIYRARRRLAAAGVQPAPDAVRRAKQLGIALGAAIERAEGAPPEQRAAALAAVAQLGEQLYSDIDSQWEGIRGLLEELISGVRGDRPALPRAPERFRG